MEVSEAESRGRGGIIALKPVALCQMIRGKGQTPARDGIQLFIEHKGLSDMHCHLGPGGLELRVNHCRAEHRRLFDVNPLRLGIPVNPE